MTKLAKDKRTKIFLTAGMLQLLLAAAAFSYFLYLKTNAQTAKSVGSVVNEAITRQQQATANPQPLRAPSASFTAHNLEPSEQTPLIEGALIKPAAFQRPQQTPKPNESPECVHYRIVSNTETYYPGQKITLEFQLLKVPRGTSVDGFLWSVKNAVIESGQSTKSITIDTSKSSGQIDWDLHVQLVSFQDNTCEIQETARPEIREVPPPATPAPPSPTPTPSKVQRFEGGLDFGQNVPPSKAGITVKGYLGGSVVEATTDQFGRFSFETDRRGRFFFSFSSGGRQHKGQDIDLIDGKSDLGLISIDVGPPPTPEATHEQPGSVPKQGAETGEFSVNWPHALMRGDEGVVTITYTPPAPGTAPRLGEKYRQVQLRLSAAVDGLILLGEPDVREFATLGGEPRTWSYTVKVKEEAGSTATCNIDLELRLTSETGTPINLPMISLAAALIGVPTIPPGTWLAGVTVFTPSGLATLGFGLFPGKPRFVNTSIVNREKQTVPPNTELGMDRSYYVRINIGPLSKESIVQNPVPFPSRLLPQGKGDGQWLDVVAASDDFQLNRHRYTLFLPAKGPSWVCECNPEQAHTCNKKTRQAYLDVAIEPLKITTDAKLRLNIYYANNLIQSQLMNFAIAETEREGQKFGSTIDYTLAKSLDSLSSFSPRTMNILTNHNDDGTHKIVINGKLDDAIEFNLTEGQISNAVGAVRYKLRDLYLKEYGGFLGTPIKIRSSYDQNNAKDKAEFINDLKELADRGWCLWVALFRTQYARGRELSTTVLKAPGTIQVSRVRGSDLVFPWGAVYDIPVDSDPKLLHTCRLVDEWEIAGTLLDPDRPDCPYIDTHTRNTICPFGFWGFKHFIEQLPSMPKERDVQRTIQVSKRPIELLTALSMDLDSQLSKIHLEELEAKLSSTVKVIPYRSRKEIETALCHPKVELIYFYCHGGRAELPGSTSPTPFLGIGKKERLTPNDLVAWASDWGTGHWMDTSPLVFINGCHTAEITPESLVNFVDSFVGVYAAGVIGTEIILDQRIANEAGATFFYYFKNQHCSVGQALQQVRRTLLLKGNVLGLVYTPYCSVDLHLS